MKNLFLSTASAFVMTMVAFQVSPANASMTAPTDDGLKACQMALDGKTTHVELPSDRLKVVIEEPQPDGVPQIHPKLPDELATPDGPPKIISPDPNRDSGVPTGGPMPPLVYGKPSTGDDLPPCIPGTVNFRACRDPGDVSKLPKGGSGPIIYDKEGGVVSKLPTGSGPIIPTDKTKVSTKPTYGDDARVPTRRTGSGGVVDDEATFLAEYNRKLDIAKSGELDEQAKAAIDAAKASGKTGLNKDGTPVSPWDYMVSNLRGDTPLNKAMIAAGEKMTLEERNAALEKLNAFQKELYGKDATIYKNVKSDGYDNLVSNMFITGSISNPKYYEERREQQQLVVDAFQKQFGRNPTNDEIYYNTQTGGNIFANERIFDERHRKNIEQGILYSGYGIRATKYTDAQVTDGVKDYIKNNPGATEAQIRKVATEQYGIDKEQLDRVKAKSFSQPTTPTRNPVRKYDNAQVADGVKDYIKNNPGATEEQIRKVATEQYGIQKDQLDEVKAEHFTPTKTTTTTRPKREYDNSQVADGVKDYIKNNPGATEDEIRKVATEKYGIQKDQLDEVKSQYFQ